MEPPLINVVGTPSIWLVRGRSFALLPFELIGASPNITNPPHLPFSALVRLLSFARTEVKMIGFSLVPFAMILAPLETIKVGACKPCFS